VTLRNQSTSWIYICIGSLLRCVLFSRFVYYRYLRKSSHASLSFIYLTQFTYRFFYIVDVAGDTAGSLPVRQSQYHTEALFNKIFHNMEKEENKLLLGT
jgi:hypothetical protein